MPAEIFETDQDWANLRILMRCKARKLITKKVVVGDCKIKILLANYPISMPLATLPTKSTIDTTPKSRVLLN